jgi:hypothetical protein
MRLFSKLRNPKPMRLIRWDQVVERFARAVGDPGHVQVDDLGEPLPDGALKPLDLGGHGASEAMGLELFEDGVCLVELPTAIEVARRSLIRLAITTSPFGSPSSRSDHRRAVAAWSSVSSPMTSTRRA